jgi:hypothetical protein
MWTDLKIDWFFEMDFDAETRTILIISHIDH